jgi:hypothetical protein
MGRAETGFSLIMVAALALVAAAAYPWAICAQNTGPLPRLSLKLPAELHAGQHAVLTVEVELPARAGQPLLLTPFREGESIEIVRGRLLRSDARDASETPLHFELPILAHAAGAAVVGVKLLAYLCEPRCRAVEVEARSNLVVLPR